MLESKFGMNILSHKFLKNDVQMINALAANAIKILKLMIFKIFYGFHGSKRKFKLHLELFGNWRDIARVNFKCII